MQCPSRGTSPSAAQFRRPRDIRDCVVPKSAQGTSSRGGCVAARRRDTSAAVAGGIGAGVSGSVPHSGSHELRYPLVPLVRVPVCACRTRTVWRYQHVAVLSGLLPTLAPYIPGQVAPASTDCHDSRSVQVCHLHSVRQRLVAHDAVDSQVDKVQVGQRTVREKWASSCHCAISRVMGSRTARRRHRELVQRRMKVLAGYPVQD
jgi:hypothetical protein